MKNETKQGHFTVLSKHRWKTRSLCHPQKTKHCPLSADMRACWLLYQLPALPSLCSALPVELPLLSDSSQSRVNPFFLVASFKSLTESLDPLVSESEVAQSGPTLCNPVDTRLLCPWDFLGKSTEVGYHFLFQGIFPTQGSNPGLPYCRQMVYHLSHQGRAARGPASQRKWECDPNEDFTLILSMDTLPRKSLLPVLTRKQFKLHDYQEFCLFLFTKMSQVSSIFIFPHPRTSDTQQQPKNIF